MAVQWILTAQESPSNPDQMERAGAIAGTSHRGAVQTDDSVSLFRRTRNCLQSTLNNSAALPLTFSSLHSTVAVPTYHFSVHYACGFC